MPDFVSMSPTLSGLTPQEIADAYRDYAQVLIDASIGGSVTHLAQSVTNHGGIADKIKHASSREKLFEAIETTNVFMASTKPLLLFFIHQDEKVHKAAPLFAFFDFLRNERTVLLSQSIEEESQNFLMHHMNDTRGFSEPALLQESYPSYKPPERGTIEIAFVQAGAQTTKLKSISWSKVGDLQKLLYRALEEGSWVKGYDYQPIAYVREQQAFQLHQATREVLRDLEGRPNIFPQYTSTVFWKSPAP